MTQLLPACGRDYKSIKALLADIDANKDFIIDDLFGPLRDSDGRYINKPQLLEKGITRIKVRYARKTKQTFINIKA